MVKFKPVIKWSGSKRSQAEEIIKYFPQKMKTYYEPFCGGASMMRHLLDCRDIIQVDNIECSDLNSDLIGLWNCVKDCPDDVAAHYEKLWKELNATDDKAVKREYFNFVRARFNKERNPLDFMFIMRTTTNGMPRYNADNQFNNSFHITRDGIEPDTLAKIIEDWSDLLKQNDVKFIHRSYSDIVPDSEDFLYMDPPYASVKKNAMYLGNFDTDAFFDWLRSLKDIPYLLSYDGISGEIDNTYDVSAELYDTHDYIKSGNSSFKRTIGKSNDSIVYESLYSKNIKNPVRDMYKTNTLF